MKIDFSQVLNQLNGAPIMDGNEPFTLGNAAASAALSTFQDETNISAATKVKRFKVAQACAAGGVQDLPVEVVAEIKTLIGKAFGALVVGRVYELLDGAE